MILVLSREAEKDYFRLQKIERSKIQRRLKFIAENPFSSKMLSGKLNDLFSTRAWPYRVIYRVNKKESRIEVLRILHRQGAYK